MRSLHFHDRCGARLAGIGLPLENCPPLLYSLYGCRVAQQLFHEVTVSRHRAVGARDQQEMGGGMRDRANDALDPEIGIVVSGSLPLTLRHGTELCRLLETRLADLKHPAQREAVDERIYVVLVKRKTVARYSI